MSILKALALSLVLLTATHANAGPYSDEQIAQTLQWETKWNRITDRAIDKYLDRLNQSRLSGAAPDVRTRAIGEVRTFLSDRLSWQAEGRTLIGTLYKRCDRSVLEAMTASKLGKAFTRERRKEIARQFRECATPGYKHAMKGLAKRFSSLRQPVNKIIKRHAKAK